MGCINSTNKSLYALKRDDIFNVSVVRVQADQPMVLARHGFLEITPHELIFVAPEEETVSWSLQHLRRYGLTGNTFSFEAGRRCSTGPGIFTFRCCNADQFYVKFQSSINAMSVLGDRSNSSIHPSHLFSRIENHQSHTNHYLEPTSVQVPAPIDDSTFMTETFSNDSNLNSPDSVQSTSLTAQIISFPLSTPSYTNVTPNPHGSNIYMEQPLRMNCEHNNNISINEIVEPTDTIQYKTTSKTVLKSSSLDIPPDECAPVLNTNVEIQRVYENIDGKCITISHNNCSTFSERSYANVEILPKLETVIKHRKSLQIDLIADQEQSPLTNCPNVNYIILDLDQPRSPSQCSAKKEFGSGQSLSYNGGNVTKFKKDEVLATALSCGSSTMPKRSTIIDESSKLRNKMESSGSYTRIDFLKTFALMKSSTNYADFELENDQEESRITRHSKFVRKSYSISE